MSVRRDPSAPQILKRSRAHGLRILLFRFLRKRAKKFARFLIGRALVSKQFLSRELKQVVTKIEDCHCNLSTQASR